MAALLVFLFALICAGAPAPTPDSGRIALRVGKILGTEHYRHQPLDDSVSRQFLQIYLDTLDYYPLFFLQSDVAEFQEKYSTLLDNNTMDGNVQPAFDIFARYLQRVEQRTALVKELLKEKFSFDTEESILKDRREVPWPADEKEARQLWRQHIKSELLLGRLNQKKPAEIQETISRR